MGRARAKWVRQYENLPPGVVMCHETMVAGWRLRAELILHGVGTLQVRVNNEYVGPPMMECTLAAGRRHYQAVLKRLTRPHQAKLPI
ncbi:MAG TPA: hypothetical protein VD973_12240 [Symbiobacteriaceae bacterium]|nr:hypothetical protein [Symbiobacteriaceae bacterium]